MRRLFLCCLPLLLFVSCKKEQGPKVDLYLLKSYTETINQTTTPATLSLSNAVLDDAPFVADEDIRYYKKSTTTFTLKKNIKPIIHDYGADKAFAITVDKQPVYFGKFHPAYLSSIQFGVATIDPVLFSDNELTIQFAMITGSSDLQQLDKRNDSRIINALKASGRLK